MTWQLIVSGHPEDNSPEHQEAIADRAQHLVDELRDSDAGMFEAQFASNDVQRDLLANDEES